MAPSRTASIPQRIVDYVRDHRPPVDFTRPLSSPMVDFYRDKCVFLTGGTGFLGQLFVEKLLRTGVRRVYVLARPKKGRNTAERLRETFTGDVFARLHDADPEYMERVRAIDGDMAELRLGISDADYAEVVDNVQIVLHSAAEVRFDETLQHLLLVNLRGTREVLRLAESLRQLEVFVHISTAYSHCPNAVIDERFYAVPMQPDQMIALAESLAGENQRQFRELSEKVIEPWPNTYTYTKALAEELVRQFGQRIPVAVMRPSIVIATYSDPIPGWINNIYGLTGVLLASGLGFHRVLPYDEKMKGDFVCADFVINSTLAVAWATYEECKSIKLSTKPAIDCNNNPDTINNNIDTIDDNNDCYPMPSNWPTPSTPTPSSATSTNTVDVAAAGNVPEPKVYHVISYQDRPLTYKQVQIMAEQTHHDMPSVKSLWLPSSNTIRWRWTEVFYIVLYHIIPAYLFDTVFWLSGAKLRLMPMYRKAHKFVDANTYFMRRQWAFGNSQIKTVYARMSHDDRRFFPSDVREYNFRDFMPLYQMGVHVYVLNETEYDERWAHTRMRLLRAAHCVVLLVLYAAYAAVAYVVLSQFGYWNAVVSVALVIRQTLVQLLMAV